MGTNPSTLLLTNLANIPYGSFRDLTDYDTGTFPKNDHTNASQTLISSSTNRDPATVIPSRPLAKASILPEAWDE